MKQVCQPHSLPHDTGMAVKRIAIPQVRLKDAQLGPLFQDEVL